MSHATSRPDQAPSSIGQHSTFTDCEGGCDSCRIGPLPCCGSVDPAMTAHASSVETEWRPLDPATQPALWSLLFEESPASLEGQIREGRA